MYSNTVLDLVVVAVQTWLEVLMRWILCNFPFSLLGRPASLRHQLSNLFHCLDLLLLVSSEYRITGNITTGLLRAAAFKRKGVVYEVYSYIIIQQKNHKHYNSCMTDSMIFVVRYIYINTS